jgi:hypothetical protein
MELSCDVAMKTPESRPRETELRTADVLKCRPKRNAAAMAECCIQDKADDEQD